MPRCHVTLPNDRFRVKRCGNLEKCCISCNEVSKLRQRQARAREGRVFQCPQCEYKCGENSHLQRHIKTVHLLEKNHHCHTCEYKCGRNNSLQIHIKTVHLLEKTHQCPTCTAKFGLNGSLQIHIKTVHLLEKTHQCPTCEYKCGTNGDLQRHIKICTGELNCSGGEYKILQLFERIGLVQNEDYLFNTTVWNVRDKKLLRWDFVVGHTSDTPLVVEFDGAAHFRPVCFGGISQEQAEENFVTAQRRDRIKDAHCLANNIPILRIHFKDIDALDDIVTAFLTAHTPPQETA